MNIKILLFLLITLSNTIEATDYGFIIGIGRYKDKSVPRLNKVNSDINTYKKILKRIGVRNIYTLKNQNATKKRILNHLSYISKKIKKGDNFFMFYSGHGVSLRDEAYSSKLQEAGLTNAMRNSDAILPYDFDSQNIARTIILGKELRKYLKVIDKKVAKSLIVFDACFSKNSIKNMKPKHRINRTPNILTKNKSYPYKNIVYIASSIIEAKPGKFSPILDSCLTKQTPLYQIKQCINRKVEKSMQIPAIFSNRNDIKF